eukprot:6200157-Pleurochrysis_carterae.AAC.1
MHACPNSATAVCEAPCCISQTSAMPSRGVVSAYDSAPKSETPTLSVRKREMRSLQTARMRPGVGCVCACARACARVHGPACVRACVRLTSVCADAECEQRRLRLRQPRLRQVRDVLRIREAPSDCGAQSQS